MPFSDKSVDVGTRRLRYREAAAVPGVRARGTLLLLHAFPVNACMWDAQASLADEGWRVIAPQFRGFDAAPEDPPARSVDDYAGDTIDLLDALHIDDAAVCGLSMGGYVAFALFRAAPRYIRALVLADTRPQADTAEGVAARKKMLQLVEDKGADAVADEMLPKLLGDTTRRTRPDIVDSVRRIICANSPDAIAGAVHALMTRPDSTKLLSSIHCPTLILVGNEDRVTPPEVAVEMHRAIGGAILMTIENAGHLSNLEQPRAFNDALAGFLAHRV